MIGLAGRLADLASGAMLDNAQVTGLSRLSSEFIRMTLSAEAFRKATWVPGAKLQLRPRRGSMSLRTYTPTSWDAARGVTELVVYTHGNGPAAQWFERVAEGQTCEVFGPRRSIDMREAAGPVLFVGDETSVALARALRTTPAETSYVFEARDPIALTDVLAQLGDHRTSGGRHEGHQPGGASPARPHSGHPGAVHPHQRHRRRGDRARRTTRQPWVAAKAPAGQRQGVLGRGPHRPRLTA